MGFRAPWPTPSRVPVGIRLKIAKNGEDPRVVELSEAFSTLGRSADIITSSATSSRVHAVLAFNEAGDLYVIDQSAHGTYVDDKRLKAKEPKKLDNHMVISFGQKPHTETFGVRGLRPAKKLKIDLYADLPIATVTKVETAASVSTPKAARKTDHTKALFLDIDGVIRPVHGRENFMKNRATIAIGGTKVALIGGGEGKAGLDFWPEALRALRWITQKTSAMIVLSSDWRKDHELVAGVESSLREYEIPPLEGCTPDLDKTASNPGVMQVLHASFREKRCKEIRAWLKGHPEVTKFVAIDDVDLSTSSTRIPPKTTLGLELEELPHAPQGDAPPFPLLDPAKDFVRTVPSTGLNMHLARLVVSLLGPEMPDPQEIIDTYQRCQTDA